METKHLVYDYNLQLKGVFGRNRTAKFQSVRLARAERDATQPTAEELRQLTDSMLSEMKFKTGTWAVKQAPVEVGEMFESFLLFSDVTMLTGSKD